MIPHPPGRRTESLFDNRYRYDHIYPRGRSGETLRAYDTRDDNRPVVIKRPAPQDAPPMRAGQEVSIRTEKQALERLSGHSVLTELRGSGVFRVGGHTHEYIVMDLAQGQIVEDMVLAEQGKYLPELEVLVIMDNLLDLLAYAHDKQVVYNDVDAKHLFWDRESYRLKVIDWGNAIFLDEPGALPSVTRATDIYQCGELLYFLLTGGNRLATAAEEGETFFVNFGADAERIPARLQAILTRAVHPDPKRRYGTILELRHALAEYRAPLEKTRDDIVSHVRKRVRPTASQEELEELAGTLHTALESDPGYPPATALAAEIRSLLKQIAMQADLDAIRIYLESGNWPRAHSLLHDLLANVDKAHEPLIRFLIAAAALLENLRISPAPAGFSNALTPLFGGDAPAAGRILLTTGEARPAARQAQWLLAEQLTTLVSDVTLLRPHIVRLRLELQNRPGAALSLLEEADSTLATIPIPGLTGLKVIYQQTASVLARLEKVLEQQPGEPAEQGLMAAAVRAQHAAHEVVARLEEVGGCAFSDPSRASGLLQKAAMIDPTSPHFDALHDYFDEIHQALQALAQFRPNSSGTNLMAWFADVQEFFQPYLDDIPDPQFHAALNAVRSAAEGWTTIVNFLALGRRQPTIEALRSTAEIIRPYNENLAAWLGAMANRLPDVAYVERHSPNEALADALIEGWRAWDRGDGIQAGALGRDAYERATTDGERLAANRLRQIGDLLDNWLANQGPADPERTDQAETRTISLLLTEEEQERRRFAEQMPNTSLYLRAMNRGIVAYMRGSSSAGWRALYMHYVLRGMLALQANDLDEAEFWRNAATNCFDNARTHRVFQALDRGLTGRRLVQAAERALNAVTGPSDLESVRQTLNAPLAGELLTGAEQAVQMATEALRHWSDGEFYNTRQTLDAALAHIQTAIQVANLQIDSFVEWLAGLRDAAADLQHARLTIEQGATTTSPDPDPAIAEAHLRIVTKTVETVGPEYAHQVRQWQDMYQAVLETYTSQRLTRREKLATFNRHFASLFIVKHPAYPLFRHWESVISQMPPDVAEDEVIDVSAANAPPNENASPAYLEDDHELESATPTPRVTGNDLPWNWIIIGAVIILLTAVGFAVLRSQGGKDDSASTGPKGSHGGAAPTPLISPVPTQGAPPVAPPLVSSPTHTAMPTSPPTVTPRPPTLTDTPTERASPTLFVTSTLVPPTNTPEAVAAAPFSASGPNKSILEALARLPAGDRPWPAGAFTANEAGSWRLSTASSAGNTTIIVLSPELLSTLFQPGAANTLVSANVVLRLIRYDQAAMERGEVSVGLGAENLNDQRAMGQIQFVENTYVRMGLNQNDRFQARTEGPQPNPAIELSVRRMDANTLGFFVDGKHLGDSVLVFPQGAPVTLSLYASGAGVEVEVSRFEIDYRPRSELP